jgi:heat shock protein HslJ
MISPPRPLRPVVAILFLAALVQACGGDQKAQTNDLKPPILTLSQLKNMGYDGFDGINGPIVLIQGVWEGEPYEKGAAARPRLSFAGDFRLEGDLDGDGVTESAVLLNLATGGSGQLLYLCVASIRDGHPVNLATALVGDRVQIRGGKVIDNNIILDVVEPGPGDGACCPGQLASYGWTYGAEGTLTRSILSDSAGRLSLALLENQEWVLRYWDREEPAPAKPVVFVSYSGGRLVGSAGCNRFFASIAEGRSAGDVTVGPAGSTQMACPEEEMKVETRFLAQLARVTKFGFMLGRLALTYQSDGGVGTMQFDRR